MSYLCPPFVKEFGPRPQELNAYIMVFIDWTNTGQLSYLCPAFVLAQACGPPNSLPTKTNYRQMLDNVLLMYSFCQAIKSVAMPNASIHPYTSQNNSNNNRNQAMVGRQAGRGPQFNSPF